MSLTLPRSINEATFSKALDRLRATPGAEKVLTSDEELAEFRDPFEVKRFYETAKLLVREVGREGYGEYRAHLDFMDLAAEQYSFNDHAYRRFCGTIKDAVDPNGILSPGRHGIWPVSLRPPRP